MGPVGWALMVFDLLSLILDLFNVGNYDNVQSAEVFLTESEKAKKLYEDYLQEQRQKLIDDGIENPNMNYPRIVGPLDNLNLKYFEEKLEKYDEKILDDKTKEFFIEYFTDEENMTSDKFEKLANQYLDFLFNEDAGNKNYFQKYENKNWSDVTDDDKKLYIILGWNKNNFNSNTKPELYNKKWKELSVDERNAAFLLGYNCSIWNNEECLENPFKDMTGDELIVKSFY